MGDGASQQLSQPPPPPPVISPTLFLLGASLPFALGAYGGYRREVRRSAAAGGENYHPGGGPGAVGEGIVSKLMQGAENRSALQSRKSVGTGLARAGGGMNPAGPVLAARALIIGSMMSIGGVGIFSAAIFYASGYESIDEAVRSLREWGPRKRSEMEKMIGLSEGGESSSHPDILATKGMSEEEELEYVKRKYLSEFYEEDANEEGKHI